VSRSFEKFVVYSAMTSGNQTVVAQAWCKWSDRNLWERRLTQLVGSLRP
jgi:hypothetical protein